ncbi:MAG: 50S ribosomal protein L18 [Candidatus Eisenbacteria bacterium]|nr:50S ribosomal protein L18 [Candidatus Eisenbacteria bacterium]
MDKSLARRLARERRHKRIRRRVSGTGERPRVSVYRSSKHIYAQVVDDARGVTLVSVASGTKEVKARLQDKKGKIAAATACGEVLAEKAKAKGITAVCFDRGGYLYHGRVKALAEAARNAGLQF